MADYGELFDLSGKTVLAVGGAGGIGGRVSAALPDFGANVVIVDVLDKAAEKILKEIGDRGKKATFIRADCTRVEEIDRVVERVLSEHGRIDVDVNFLGTTVRKPALELSQEEWDRVLHLNLTTVFNICRAVARPMLAQKKGKIINYSSVSGVIARQAYAIYSASKAGLINLSKVLCNEWAADGINVNVIAPAGVKTEFNRKHFEENPDAEKRLIAEIPAGRLGRPEDHIGPVVFLASEASNFVNGQVLFVDGGRMVM
jgi:NAD(P)-dependent dehydrogenase (short-subunit alcohol dehydrogenase family)